MFSSRLLFGIFLSFVSLHVFAEIPICELILGSQVGFFNEAASEMSGKPLVNNVGEVTSIPYTRTYYRKIDGEHVKLAVIKAEDHTPELERDLQKLGFLGVAIANPSYQAIQEKTDFILVSDWYRMVMEAPKSVEDWLSRLPGSTQNQLKRKLKKSKDIQLEIADLNWGDYDLWYRNLFEKEIANRNGAVPAWKPPQQQAEILRLKIDPTLPLSEQAIPNFKRIFFYHEGELVGGSLLQWTNEDQMLRVRAAAFEHHARENFQLAVRGFAKTIEIGKAMGARQLSYGEDTSFFGIDTTVGLLQFKSEIGMYIVPSPMITATQLVKFFPTGLLDLKRQFLTDLEEDAKEKGRDYSPKPFPGIVVLGIPGDDPNRVESSRLLDRARNIHLPYETRVRLTQNIITALQIQADPDANPAKPPPGHKLRALHLPR